MKNGGLMGFNIDLTNKNGGFNGIYRYTLWWTYKKLLNMALEIVDLPIKQCDFP